MKVQFLHFLALHISHTYEKKKTDSSSEETNKTEETVIEKDHLGDWSPSQDSSHPDDLFQSRYVTPGFKPFS